MKNAIVFCLVLVVAAVVVAADMDAVEEAVTGAKAAYVADPSAENLSALDQAAAAFQDGVTKHKAMATETEPNDTSATANPITAVFVDGFLPVGAVDVDYFSFSATAGDLIEVIVDDDPDAGGTGSATDTELDLLDTDGSTVLAAGSDGSGNPNNCAGSTLAPSTGTYFVRIGDGGFGSDGTYRFTVVINGGSVPVELMIFDIE